MWFFFNLVEKHIDMLPHSCHYLMWNLNYQEININLSGYNIHLIINILYNINVRIFCSFFVALCRQT